jgi:hypothetical protein
MEASTVSEPSKTYGVLATLSLLTPWDAVGCGKRRVGGDGDGGYVLLDRLRPEQAVLSYGVGPDCTFDTDLAKRGHHVLMFDHTVERPPGGTPKGCIFTREGVAVSAQPEKRLDTIEAHLHRHGLRNRHDLILKMDIEGAEWDVLAGLPENILDAFEQIVVEFHGLNALNRDAFGARARAAFQRLNARFTLCHVHANAYGGLAMIEGVVLPPVLEASYVRSDLITRTPNRTLYPTEYDRANRPGTKDIVLSMYPFMPMAVPNASLAPLARRLDAEHAAWVAAHPPKPPMETGAA